MKKVYFVASLFLVFSVAGFAQTTKVSKKIEVFSWLDAAVAASNQVEGGLHSYTGWADMTSSLKLAQVQVGMMVTLTDIAGDGSVRPATYRLASWTTTTALPLQSEWERVGDMIVVADTTALNNLVDPNDNGLEKMAIGTMVMVRSNANSIPETFVYVEDLDGDGDTNEKDYWFSFSGSDAASFGYVYLTTVTTGLSGASDGYYAGATTSGAITTQGKLSEIPTGTAITYDISSLAAELPVIALPKAWEKPNFYITTDDGTFQLNDCWEVTYDTKDDIDYQVWSCDVALASDYAGTILDIVVR